MSEDTQNAPVKATKKKMPVLKATKALSVPVKAKSASSKKAVAKPAAKKAKVAPIAQPAEQPEPPETEAKVAPIAQPAEQPEPPETEIPEMAADGTTKLPQTIQGKGYKLVNLNSSDNASIVIERKEAAELLYNWNSDRFPYTYVASVNGGMPASVPLSYLLSAENFEELKDDFPSLFVSLEKTAIARKAMITQILTENKPVAYELLTECLAPSIGSYVFISRGSENMYGKLTKVVAEDSSWGGRKTLVKFTMFEWTNGKLNTQSARLLIRPDGQSRRLAEWGIDTKPSQYQLDALFERGKKVIDLNNNCAYVGVQGNLTYKLGWFTREAPATGRAIVDKSGHALFNPNDTDHNYDRDHEDHVIECALATADEIRSMSPELTIFSFVAKKWGKIDVSQVTDIKFREDAFEKLVMPAVDKKLVHTLVKNSDASLTSDLIDNKGGGCVLLLHGKPGLGKTLTAEAVAETLKRPLYAVSVGELGTDPESLDAKLQTVLQTAQRWNAVLLLDEADVFLETRRSGDINRNAMVGTFLRLLEYYNGVLILTTNRVADMDQAFYSRIAVALRYDDFDTATREQVLSNLLATNGVTLTQPEIAKIANLSVNGRQVKNAIRISRYMAKEESRAVCAEDIILVLNKLHDFQTSFNTPGV